MVEEKTSYVEDVQFVSSEINRISKLDSKEYLQGLKWPEHVAMLPHPSGHGQIPCGMQAYRRLQKMASTGLSRSQYAGRIDAEIVFKNLQLIIVDRFMKERRPFDQREVDRAVSSAIRRAANNISDITHYIPCHLGHIKTPEGFFVGSVHFQQTDKAFDKLGPAFEAYLQKSEKLSAQEGGNRRETSEELLAEAKSYYQSFGWIAEIKVENCDNNISKKLAERKSQSALDCLHLMIGAAYSNHMRSGGAIFNTDRRSHIKVDAEKTASINFSVDWLAHNLGESWWEDISQQYAKILKLVEIAIEEGNDPNNPAPLAQRFIDAASWYGEAVRDPFPASRMIKYVTAIERILTTKNHKYIAETIAHRGSALIFRKDIDDWEHLKERFKNVYDCRSRLVHGSSSPHERGLGKDLAEAEELARFVLFGSLLFFGPEGLKKKKVSIRNIDKNYNILVNAAKSGSN